MKKLSRLVFCIVILITIFSKDIRSQTPVGTGETYPTLKSAFDAINGGTLTGDVVLKITSNITESATATLNASGTGGANYTSVVVYPDGEYLISSNIEGALIQFNGADNVTINGSVDQGNATKDLTIHNMNTSYFVSSSIQFTADACNNTIKYCNLKGNNSDYSHGIIYMNGGTTTGNDNNTIDNCNIDGEGTARNCIYATSTSGEENTSNTVSNCNLFDFYQSSGSVYGIKIAAHSNNWTINNNSFYQTVSRSIGSSFRAIGLDAVSVDGFNITNNKFGGTEANCGGGVMTLTGSGILQMIYTNSGSTGVSIQGNTIKNISFTSSNSSNTSDENTFIYHVSGKANIGSITGNTIGDQSSTGNISISLSGSGSAFQGILTGTGTPTNINISNNSIGSINFGITGSPTTVPKFYGIYTQGTSTTNIISGNAIGSATTSNSITSSANSVFYGIYSTSSTIGQSISNNIIANIQLTGTSTGNQFIGIYTPGNLGGSFNISENTVRDVSTLSTNTGVSENASIVGIVMNGSTSAGQTVSKNLIFSLSNTCSTEQVEVTGIYYAGPTTGNIIIEKNNIHSVNLYTTNANAYIFGIKVGGGKTKCVNNMVSLGKNASGASNTRPNIVYGIYDGSGTNDYYYNSVCIGGTEVTNTASTYAFYNVTTNIRNFNNNIFINNRSSTTAGTGKHYAVRYANVSNLTADYNDIFVSGTGGKIGSYSGDINDLAAWRTATGKDANSVSEAVRFMSNTDLHVDISVEGILTGIGGKGTGGTGITTDYDGNTRKSNPDIGASEFTAEQNGSIGNGLNTTYSFGGAQRGVITWHGDNLPTSVSFAFVQNTTPPGAASGNKVSQYWSVTNTGGTGFTYDITLYYNVSYLNGIPEANLRPAKSDDGGNTYTLYSTPGTGAGNYELNEEFNWIKVYGLSSFSLFTLTDADQPLPVKVSGFSAVVNSRDIKLNWVTESEENNMGFFIEREEQEKLEEQGEQGNQLQQGKQLLQGEQEKREEQEKQWKRNKEPGTEWESIGYVKGKGTKISPTSYEFEDKKMETGKYRYRLKQVDFNGNFDYFYPVGDVEVGVPEKFRLGQNYPNPFNPSTKIDFDLRFDSRVMLVVYDVTGREVSRLINNEFRKEGYYTAEFNGGSISSGLYFYRLSTEGFVQARKMILLR